MFNKINHLNEEYCNGKWKETDCSYIYKLTYKQKFCKLTKNGKLTNYGYIINQYIN